MCKDNNKKQSQDLREELQHSKRGSDLERRSMTFTQRKELRNSTIKYEQPSKPDDSKFKIEDD